MKIWNEIEEDVFNYFNWFGRIETYQKLGYMPNLSVFSINARQNTDIISKKLFLSEAAKTINEVFRYNRCLNNYTFYLFANIEINYSSSVITKHRKIWKTLNTKWSLQNFICGQEIEFEIARGDSIFTSIASFEYSELEKSLEIVSTNPKLFTIVASLRTDLINSEAITSIFQNSNIEDISEIDYFELSIKQCSENDIVFRFGDSSEEIELALVFQNELLDAFKKAYVV